MSKTEYSTPLKEAIRLYWNACKLLDEAQVEDHGSFVIENRKEDVMRYEAQIEAYQEKVSTFILTDSEVCDWLTDEQLIPADIEMLLQRGIIHECLGCEEREDLVDVYEGDHREFHQSGDHQDACVLKALHEYDSRRWPTFSLPTDEYDACEECGIKAVQEGESDA